MRLPGLKAAPRSDRTLAGLVVLVWLCSGLPMPATAASFSDNFSTNPAGRWVNRGAGIYTWNGAQLVMALDRNGTSPNFPAWDPNCLINTNGAVVSALLSVSSTQVTGRWQIIDEYGRIAYRTETLTTTPTTRTVTINSTNFTAAAGFNFGYVRYVGFYFTTNSNVTRYGYLDNFSLTGFSYTPQPAAWVLALVGNAIAAWRRRVQPPPPPPKTVLS